MSDEKDKKSSVWSKYTDEEKVQLENLGKSYIDFISRCKTERESVKEAIICAEKAGYKNFENF